MSCLSPHKVMCGCLHVSSVSKPFLPGSQVALVGKNPLASVGEARDAGLIPGPGRSPGGGNGNPLQYSCLKSSMGREAWRAMVHRTTKSWTREHNWRTTAEPIQVQKLFFLLSQNIQSKFSFFTQSNMWISAYFPRL